MAKKSSGRMINVDISLSSKIASLSAESLSLFCLLIPHFNAHGKMLADPHLVKGLVCPLVSWLTTNKIDKCLCEISEKTSVKYWQDEKGLHYLQSLNWSEHQNLRSDRLGPDHLPDYSESSPGVVKEAPAKGKGREVEEEVKEEVEGKASAPYLEIINYLNEKTGKNYKSTSAATQRAIRARLAEGFNVNDFKAVIDNKVYEWLDDGKMNQYLRPETLFGNKFEGYLNNKPTQRKNAMQADMDDLDALLGGDNGKQGMGKTDGCVNAQSSKVIELERHTGWNYG